jgi:hypothetical protein
MLSPKEDSMAELSTLGPFEVPSAAKRRYGAMVKLIGYLQSGLHPLLTQKKHRLGNNSTFRMFEGKRQRSRA